MKTKIKQIIPFIILFSLLGLLWHELFSPTPHELPSVLVGEAVPAFQLPDITHGNLPFTQNDLLGHVSLLNVWASWCYACGIEHPMLLKIQQQYHVPIYSIDYKDSRDDAKKWLQTKGNPYLAVGDDSNGDVAIDLGVYGTPETFVINPKGDIVYRHIGVIDQATWDNVLYPLIQKYQGTKS